MTLARGIIAMLVTPFDREYRLNEAALRREVAWCLDHGATGIVATPSIGEFLHLDEAERTRAMEVTLSASEHRVGRMPGSANHTATRTSADCGTFDCDANIDAGAVCVARRN